MPFSQEKSITVTIIHWLLELITLKVLATQGKIYYITSPKRNTALYIKIQSYFCCFFLNAQCVVKYIFKCLISLIFFYLNIYSFFSVALVHILNHSKDLQVHFSKQFVQTAPHNGLPAKACNLLKILSSSLKSKYVNEHISAIRMTSPCVIVHKQDVSKMLSHVVIITVCWYFQI